jgi:hypothetical protein
VESRARFTYYALYPRPDRAASAVGVLAEGRVAPERPHRVVGWSHREHAWTEAEASLGAILINPDYDDRIRIVDRPTAERIAQDLGKTLPSEEEMQRIGDRAAEEYERRWGRADEPGGRSS